MDHQLDTRWLSRLRSRYTEIAGRRVPADAVEDIVQDALRIVLTKGPAAAARAGDATPPMRWCFQVLRNVIGNWYQKRRDHGTVDGLDLPDDRPDPLASLTADERARTIRLAVDELRMRSRECADWLWAMAEGMKAGPLAARAGIDPKDFYRRIYRCRQTLADILKGKGVAP